MRGKDLLKCMEYIDDALIQEASTCYIQEKSKTFPFYIRKWNAMIACVLCVFIIGITVTIIQPWDQFSKNDNSITQQIGLYSGGLPQEEAKNEFAEKPNDEPPENGIAGDLDGAKENSVLPKQNMDTTYAEQKEDEASIEIIQDSLSLSSGTDDNALLERREQYQIINSYESDVDKIICYGASDKGTYNYHEFLKTEIDKHDGENVLYYVAVVVFGDIKNEDGESNYYALRFNDSSDNTEENDLLNQELERLRILGYDVDKANNNIMGYFTQEKLEQFVPNKNYGYHFTFKSDM